MEGEVQAGLSAFHDDERHLVNFLQEDMLLLGTYLYERSIVSESGVAPVSSE